MKGRYHFAVFAALAAILCLANAASAQNCCIEASYGPSHPPNHTWQYDPANPDAPNLMMHARLCPVNCTDLVWFTGLRLQAGGTGNSVTDINWIRVTFDLNCNGAADGNEPSILHIGGFTTTGTLDICDPNLSVPVSPGKCICVLIEYNLKPSAPCNATYEFWLIGVLSGPNCQMVPLCGQPPKSATKRVLCPECCLIVDKGPNSPADHHYSCNPIVGNPPNYMLHVKICNPCQTEMPLSGIVLQAGGTGNDQTGIQSVSVYLDANCDGKADNPTPLSGAYNADNGTLTLCNPNSLYLAPDQCICLIIYYQMDCNAPPGTYWFDVVGLLGPNCLPICADTHLADGTLVPLASQPVHSAVKTIDDCCFQVTKGPNFPADHSWACNAADPGQPNFMAKFKICNPCPTFRCIGGIRLVAGGTGPLSGIQSVRVSLDYDCDGNPEVVNVLSGNYLAGNPVLDLCKQGGAFVCIEPNMCVCVRVEYQMKCDAPPGTYWFDLVSLLGTDCQPICADTLPIKSAVKTVEPQPCCLEVSPGPMMPANHTFSCPPAGGNERNFMQQVRICNPCTSPVDIYGLKLKAYGSGNDLTGINQVQVMLDANCDGTPENFLIGGTYNADDGTASLCSTGGPVLTLQPGECVCLNVYYVMKCPNPIPGTYLFELTDILGKSCQPICAKPLPIKSAVKTIEPQDCCLEISVGPNDPPAHWWFPGQPLRNRIFQFEICNPCPDRADIKCLTFQASGTGNDQNDILQVRVWIDSNCSGVRDPGEPLYGVGTYPSDNGTLTIWPVNPVIIGAATPNGPTCMCFLVEYIMKPWPVPAPPLGATYCTSLTQVCAINTTTFADFCKKGLPLKSNCKKRCKKIWEAKQGPIGVTVCLPYKLVTAVYPDRFYIEEVYGDTSTDPDLPGQTRDHAGIAVLGQVPLPPEGGALVDVEGILEVLNGEAVIHPTALTILPDPAPEPRPVAMTNQDSGGRRNGVQSAVVDSFFDVFFSAEFNTVGTLSVLTGKVTGTDGAGCFWIDDGSGLKDGTRNSAGGWNVGVKVDAQYAGPIPSVGSHVRVQGIMTAQEYFGKCIRVLMPRTRGDIIVLN